MDFSIFEKYGYVLQVLATISLLTFFISIVCIPLLVARIPRNYFHHQQHHTPPPRAPLSLGALFVLLLRNMIGLLLLLAGIAMLFLPGQGLITIVIGIAIMSFPYKRRLLTRLTRPVTVRKSLDWIRLKMQKDPFYW